jgi:MFS family permease
MLSGQNDDDDYLQAERPLPLRSLLIPRIIIAAGNYASLSLVDIAMKAIQPVFLSTPILLGGLGLPPSSIGTLLSVQGFLNGIFSIFFFAKIHDRWGAKKTFILGVASAIPGTLMYPVANTFARNQGYSIAVWIAIGIQIISAILHNQSFGAIFIFISAASPNRASLGATNGLSQLSVSIMRTIGPASVNSLFSLSIAKGYLGGHLVYYVLVAITGVALALSTMLPPSHEALSRLRS